MKIKDVFSTDGWNWNFLQMEVPKEVRRKIQATLFPYVAMNEDKLVWNPSPKGSFDL